MIYDNQAPMNEEQARLAYPPEEVATIRRFNGLGKLQADSAPSRTEAQMKVGDLVQSFLMEQLGVIVETRSSSTCWLDCRVVWATQGKSLLSPGSSEWISEQSLELASTVP